MNSAKLLFFIIISGIFGIILALSPLDDSATLYLEKSAPYIGIDAARELGFDGEGITIAVIDTGIDFNHPDLLGFGPDGKITGGKNFVQDGPPIDTNGHGTQVAGIIAADGQIRGIAPKAKVVAYKVSDDGESVSSELIIKAIEQAIVDKVDIINISLGVNKTNSRIDAAVNQAIENGIIVVTAAGNDGPALGSIGSPGINANSITVGATYNNITSSLVATLEINEKQYQVLPMVGTQKLSSPIEGEILFGEYGRERDLTGNFDGSIMLVQRGSDVKDELVYFSEKESNAADAGARAVLIYNNEQGIYLGELLHEFSDPDYYPRIPALSMSREDGLEIQKMLENKTVGKLHVFYNPDFVAYFSSRGPVSPFYNKPDMVAPGAFVNTTLSGGGYNFTSGTSFAAPHVTGAAALLLQKNPELSPLEIKSILVSTSDAVSDAYGNEFPMEISGSGRLNVTKAFDANLIILPPYLNYYISSQDKLKTESLVVRPINGEIGDLKIRYESPDILAINHTQIGNEILVSASLNEDVAGEYQARLYIDNNEVTYNIPIILKSTISSLDISEEKGLLQIGVNHPKEWTFAKITITNQETGKEYTTSSTPNSDAQVQIFENGDYWVDAKITSDGQTFDAYEKVSIHSTNGDVDVFGIIGIPERTLMLLVLIIGLLGLVGMRIRR